MKSIQNTFQFLHSGLRSFRGMFGQKLNKLKITCLCIELFVPKIFFKKALKWFFDVLIHRKGFKAEELSNKLVRRNDGSGVD